MIQNVTAIEELNDSQKDYLTGVIGYLMNALNTGVFQLPIPVELENVAKKTHLLTENIIPYETNN